MSEITPERIAELRAAHEATSFPWSVEGCTVFLDAAYIYSHGPVSICSASGANQAKTIAAARNALPDILDEIERLRHALEVSQQMVDRLVDEGEKKDAEIEGLQERIDLDVDEFRRIKAELDPLLVGLHGTMPEAISKCVASLCDRAVTAGRQRVPLIEQRDRAEAEARRLRVENDNLRSLLPKAFDAGVQSDWTRMDRDEWVANALKEIEQ